jgi:hypothetical protein
MAAVLAGKSKIRDLASGSMALEVGIFETYENS